MFETIKNIKEYCNSLTRYSRYKTREVYVGDIPCGGDNPIRIQSMTTTDTMNTKATVEQTIRMVESGCDYVRITAPSKLEAQNLSNIKDELRKRGYNVPLIADIHFTPNAAEIAAGIVEKVRINPGNYADRKRFQNVEYTNDDYAAELGRIRQKFIPLVKVCKEYGTAMRIGTNHGSLSDRIMNRYGDTPLGMVESALEFVRICEDLDYRQIILSMKASNPQVMVKAYRLLIQKMEEEGMNYPLHLGVTEAGGGEDGRIKSALGIGTLLEDGLGDTVRVSLTEDPEFEAPVAVKLVNRYNNRTEHSFIKPIKDIPFNPFEYSKKYSIEISGIGGRNVPVVIADYSNRKLINPSDLEDSGYNYNASADKWSMTDTAADFLYLGTQIIPFEFPVGLKVIYDYSIRGNLKNSSKNFFLLNSGNYLAGRNELEGVNLLSIDINSLSEKIIDKLKNDNKIILVLETKNLHGMAEQRRVYFELLNNHIDNPVILKRTYKGLSIDELMLYPSTDIGALLIDGFGDGVWIDVQGTVTEDSTQLTDNNGRYIKQFVKNESKEKVVNRLLFGILQAARVRISKTEYIACPSCGRTLFDLQETTDMIRKKTEHLKGIKIAVMGCIVNGPGEMADADYGYVGSGLKKITLYRGKEIVKRNISANTAVETLIELIKEDNNWVDPKK